MNKSPSLIIFDLGRVLVDFDFPKVVHFLKQDSPLTKKQIHDHFRHTKSWDAFERGTMTPQEFFRDLKSHLRLRTMTMKRFIPLWNDIFTVKEDSIALVKELRGRYRLAILSNVNKLHWEHIKGRHDFIAWFEHPIASYAVGQRKPEASIYRTVLKRAGVKPSQAIFIDDIKAHITAAKKIGIRGHVFTHAKRLRRDLKDIL